MGRYFLRIATLFLFLYGSLYGNDGCCDQCQFILRGEYLYFHPLIDQSYFVFEQDAPTTPALAIGERHNNHGCYTSGFRVEGIFDYCPNELDVRYTRFYHTPRRSFEAAGFLVPTKGASFFGNADNTNAKSHLHINFNEVEVLFLKLGFCCPCSINFRAGINYTSIIFREELFFTEPPTPFFTTIKQRTNFWGIGPEFDFNFLYPLSSIIPCWFDCIPICLAGDFRGGLLVSRSRAKFFEQDNTAVFTTGVSIDARNDPIYRLVPFWDMRFGFAYECNICCFGLNLEIGYEFLSFHRAIQEIFFTNSGTSPTVVTFNNELSFDLYSNLDFHGLYVALGIVF